MSTAAWASYPGAPAPGAVICAAADIPSRGVRAVDLGGFPILLVASSDGLKAFVNACPHQYLPLTYRSDAILSADGATLRCSAHDAGFDAETGQGIDGHGQGCALDPVPTRLEGGILRIAG